MEFKADIKRNGSFPSEENVFTGFSRKRPMPFSRTQVGVHQDR